MPIAYKTFPAPIPRLSSRAFFHLKLPKFSPRKPPLKNAYLTVEFYCLYMFCSWGGGVRTQNCFASDTLDLQGIKIHKSRPQPECCPWLPQYNKTAGPGESHQIARDWTTHPLSRGCMIRTCLAWGRQSLGGTQQQPTRTYREASRRWNWALHNGAWWEDKEYWPQIERRITFDTRKGFSTMRRVHQWSKLPRKAVRSPALETG